MRHFFTTENCRRVVHAVALLCCLLEQSAQHVVDAEHQIEMLMRHVNSRRSVNRVA